MESSPDSRSRNWLLRTLKKSHWSLVQRMRGRNHPERLRHADEFCRAYWYPLYFFLRSSGHGEADSQDHVQSFLARLVEDDLLASADPARGRLRNFIMTLLARHVASRLNYKAAAKRGGGVPHIPLDWADAENAWWREGRQAPSPEESFRLALAIRLVRDGIVALRKRYAENDRTDFLEAILPTLEGPLPDETYAGIARQFGMKPNAVSVAVMRMRQRFEKEVKSAAAVALAIPEGPLLDAELRDLFCGPNRPAAL
ncbi:MAG: hypothetical protein ACKV19_14030 [Verrucomicrobiales bacterium]